MNHTDVKQWNLICMIAFQRKPEESPDKDGEVKKLKQDDDQTNGEHVETANGGAPHAKAER